MPPLPDTLRAFFRRHAPVPPGGTLVLAVSGGPDSLALLHALCALRAELAASLHVAHLDHTLRGAESAAEAAFVAETARAWGVPATIDSADVRALARTRRANLYDAARAARYAFLARVAQRCGAHAVATAHHADDQAETVLAHLLRGAGPAGLAGMPPVAPWAAWAPGGGEDAAPLLIRPLLAVTRAEIEAYCAASGLVPRRDPTNDDRRYTRARIRHDLLPMLIEYNPRIVEALGRTAEACAAEHAFVEDALGAAWPALAREESGALAFAGGAWAELPNALRGAAIRRAHALLAPGATLALDDVARALDVAGGPVGRTAELPGGVALESGYGGGFRVALGAIPPPDGPQLPHESAALDVPGVVELARGWRLSADYAPVAAPRDRWEVYLDARLAAGPLMVRRRRAGDRLRPAGGPGGRRLQDVFVDAKIPRALRAAWPLVAHGDVIVWAPGVRPAAGWPAAIGAPAVRLRVTPPV